MIKIARLLLTLTSIAAATAAFAGSDQQWSSNATTESVLPPVPIDLFSAQSGYVFESDLHRETDLRGNRDFGSQDAFENEFEYGHRFQLKGNLYLHLGLAYRRFDFGNTDAPVPDHLQSFASVLSVEYMHGRDVGAFLEVRPGFYTEDHLGISSFDVPITGGRVFVLQPEKLYLFLGANASFLRGRFPVIPIAGVIWKPCDQWKLMAVLPEPKLIYSPTKKLDLWAGGQFVTGAFRTDRDDRIVPRKLNGAQVDYTEYRAGVGLAYNPTEAISLDLGGGYAIERKFDFHRAGKDYQADAAPYVRVELKAKF